MSIKKIIGKKINLKLEILGHQSAPIAQWPVSKILSEFCFRRRNNPLKRSIIMQYSTKTKILCLAELVYQP